MKKQDNGFTLVELLIVIVILGILATVTVFAVRGITDRGEKNACATELRSVETAIEAYYAQNNQQDATSIDDLLDEYLKAEPTYVTVTFPQNGGTPTVTAIDPTNCGDSQP